MPPTSDDKRIREGLKFLTRSDKTVIRAAVLLEKLEGITNPQGPADLLKEFSFEVSTSFYRGRMTQEQYTYLQGCTDTLRKFADAISRILLKMNGKVVNALTDLSSALDVPTSKVRVVALGGGIGPPPTGCCTYDTNQQSDGVSQSFCEVGLQGQWSQNPCVGQPPTKGRSPARGGR
jgi:hypothetical protein